MNLRRCITKAPCLCILLLVLPRVAWAAPPDAPLPAVSKTPAQQMLEAVGTLSAAHFYQSYLNLGLLADGVAAGTYQERDARQILASVQTTMDLVDQEIAAVAKLAVVSPRDRQSLNQMRDVSAMLRTQCTELLAYWDTREKTHADNYEHARTSAWEKIKTMLKLKE